ncbi:MAG TPA: CopD family protein [Ktedonobacteraceae bacterium]|nr:CopD family protein [Ktedonobacteraceae bacterium]
MRAQPYRGFTRRLFLVAIPLALSLLLLFPQTSQAHAILLRADPAPDSTISAVPSQVRMWFTENLNPAFTTASVLAGGAVRVDTNHSRVSSSDPTELDVPLQSGLKTAVYVVIWRTQSAADGHVLSGSFLFTLALPGDPVPTFSSVHLDPRLLQGGSVPGQLDGPTLFLLFMTTLIELGVVFWMGAQLWRNFVHQPETEQSEQTAIRQREERRFEHYFALPILGMMFLANVGILMGQAYSVTNGQWDRVFDPSVLFQLVASGQFGTYWLMRQGVIVLALAIAAYALWSRQRSERINQALLWINLLLGLALLIAMTLSGHAGGVPGSISIYSLLGDWLHLLAASLWVGGMMYIAAIYLPVLRQNPKIEQARSLLATLPRYSPLAYTGVVIMALSGPLNASVHFTSLDQLVTTDYGRALIVKVLLVGAMLLTSAIHVWRLRPRLARDYRKYLPMSESSTATAQEVKRLESSIVRQTSRLTNVLRWEPALGVAVLICTGLMTVYAGTLVPTSPNQVPILQQVTSPSSVIPPFNTTVKTTDGKFQVKLVISPNRLGLNTFTATVMDPNGQVDTNVGVSLYIGLFGMDVGAGVQALNLQPDGQGNFVAHTGITEGGRWAIRIQVRTPDSGTHEVELTEFIRV